jgi:hypothetical protein
VSQTNFQETLQFSVEWKKAVRNNTHGRELGTYIIIPSFLGIYLLAPFRVTVAWRVSKDIK